MENGEVSEPEDGEVIVEYTPLERPVAYVSKVPADLPNSDNSCDEKSESDSDDSDSPYFKLKRQKAKRHKHSNHGFNNVQTNKKNKYSIWCAELQEASLTNDLNNFGVTNSNIDRSRDVESYDYRLAYKSHDVESETEKEESNDCIGYQKYYEKPNNKRRFNERGNVKQRLGKRQDPFEDSKSSPRTLLDLKVTSEDSNEDVAVDISNKLCEKKEDLILKVVEVLGKQKAIDLFVETQKIELDGGLLIMNGQRRRTPGGVYLFKIKFDDDIPQETKQRIFVDDKRNTKLEQKVLSTKNRKKRINPKNTIISDGVLNEINLPKLLNHAELIIKKRESSNGEDMDSENRDDGEELDAEARVTNPPPSPATDGRDNSSDGVPDLPEAKEPICYDDDFLDLGCDNMDIF